MYKKMQVKFDEGNEVRYDPTVVHIHGSLTMCL